ncbi:Mediator complex subunit 2 family protein [Candida albicans]|uniref:Mediator complex subunit 2 family protein n=1 Tax=Candida albicans TaxID=5476 RepID=A0A8H6C157_CANAX|nr:Mediator complex subunit 2 family protein [Candida albicans]KAF6071091.1 Mediator complex subunit 2 family protein [Candida albicans]
MPENLQTRLHNSLDEILKSSGYIFEIIDQNRKQSNVITSPNNELIQKSITQSLNGEIQNFHAILDQTVSKLDDAEWCLGVMVEKKKKLDELKVKEEAARKKEEEAKKKEEEVKKKAEEAKKKKAETAPQKFDNFDDFIGFDINDNTNDEDMLSNMDYEDLKLDDKVPATTDNNLDMNNILENDESILDGLNMTLLDNGDHVNEEFDVDSFLNQFGN